MQQYPNQDETMSNLNEEDGQINFHREVFNQNQRQTNFSNTHQTLLPTILDLMRSALQNGMMDPNSIC